jgi:DNA-binding CsgD family transcriptional regulator/sugar-specific transcriptional regulator TrmB
MEAIRPPERRPGKILALISGVKQVVTLADACLAGSGLASRSGPPILVSSGRGSVEMALQFPRDPRAVPHGGMGMAERSEASGEEVFRALGMDSVCTRVYLRMLAEPEATAAELAEQLAVNETDVSSALDSLADLTLLRAARETPGELVPVSVERALQILLRRSTEQLAVQRSGIATLQSAMEGLLASSGDHGVARRDARVEVVQGLDSVQNRLEGLTTRAGREVASVLPGGPQAIRTLEAARPLDEDLARRGLALRSLYQQSMKTDHYNLDYARWLGGLGAEIRCAPVVPSRMIVIDRSVAIVPLDPEDPRKGALVVQEPGLVAPLLALFEQAWESADPLDPVAGGPQGEDFQPSAQERALLKLLAAGLTDEGAAKRLGISVRTARRIMAGLMDRLDASSRFEAGYRAAERNWL